MTQLLRLEWLKFRRSLTIKREVFKLVAKSIMYLYFGLMSIGLGVGVLFAINGGDSDFDIDVAALDKVGPYILYFFIVDLILRFIIQKFPTVDYKSYFLTPIKKGRLAHYILLRSLLHYFNVHALLFAIAFSITIAITLQHELGLRVLVFLCGMIILNNYLAFALSARFKAQPKTIIVIVALMILLVFLDFKKYIHISPVLQSVWTIMIHAGGVFVIPLLVSFVAYLLDFKFLRQNLYLEDANSSKGTHKNSILHFSLFDSYGKIGQLMKVELKLIFRNGRSKSFLWICLIMLYYPLMFIGQGHFTLFVSILETGMFALNYGQFVFAWNGSYFDLLLSRNVSIKNLFLAKYYLMALSCIVFLPTIFYGFLDSKYFLYIPVMCLYNVGIVMYLYMILGCFKSKRIDVQNKSTMNFEGVSFLHFLIMIPIVVIPYAIIYISRFFYSEYVGLAFLAVISILGIIFHQKIIDFILRLFVQNKYKIAHTFRTESQ